MASADNIIRRRAAVAAFAAYVTRRGFAINAFSGNVIRKKAVVVAFSDDVTRWEDGGVAFVDAVISRLAVGSAVAEVLGRVAIWAEVFARALLLCFPCHDDGNHGRVAFDASVDVVALQVEVVDEALGGVDDVASARQPIVLVAFCELDDFGSDVVDESLVFRCAE